MKKILANIIEQCSDGLEKSTVGTWTIFSCLGFIAYLLIKDGGTETVESLITTAMIIGATLMGVTSVTDMFRHDRSTGNKNGGTSCEAPPESDEQKETMELDP